MKYLLFVALLFTSVASYAEMYRWVDESGRVRIGERPTAVPADTEDSDDEEIGSIGGIAEQEDASSAVLPPKTAPGAGAPASKEAPAAPSPTPAPKALVKPKSVTESVQKIRKPVVDKAAVNTPVVSKPAVQKPATKKSTVSKPAAKKAAAKKASTKKPAPAKSEPVVKKPVAEKTPQKVPATSSDGKRNEKMCGVYRNYVRDYEDKVKDCSASLCDIYERALMRYRNKQKNYCGS